MLDFFLLLVNKAHKNIIASFVVTVKEVMSNLETHTQWRSPAAVSHTVVLFICTYFVLWAIFCRSFTICF